MSICHLNKKLAGLPPEARLLEKVSVRLSGDWQGQFGHPVLLAETFVDPQRFRGTCYKAAGWEALGQTQGYERRSQDFYVDSKHPKELLRSFRLRWPACSLRPAVSGPFASEDLVGGPKRNFQVFDPFLCPKCGGEMKIISFIERHQNEVIEKIFLFRPLSVAYCLRNPSEGVFSAYP